MTKRKTEIPISFVPERFLTDYSTRCNVVSGKNNTDDETVSILFDTYQNQPDENTKIHQQQSHIKKQRETER